MSSYLDKILTDGERVIYQAHLSLLSQMGLIVIGAILLPAFGLGLLLFVWAWLKCKSTEITITNKRIISKVGIFNRSTTEIRLDKIESIKVDQGVLGRMLNFGAITIAGTGGDKTPIESIVDPLQFQKEFMSVVDRKD